MEPPTNTEAERDSQRGDDAKGVTWQPRNPRFREAVQTTFDQQAAMRLVGAELSTIEPGVVEIHVPVRPDLTQQHGVLHGGVVAMALDAACAFAVATLLPEDRTGFTVGLDVHYLVGAVGTSLLARGEVVRIGRSVAVSTARAYARTDDADATFCAMASSTLNHFPAGPGQA
jgi:uncharacterized protein (TIGR00369 family)